MTGVQVSLDLSNLREHLHLSRSRANYDPRSVNDYRVCDPESQEFKKDKGSAVFPWVGVRGPLRSLRVPGQIGINGSSHLAGLCSHVVTLSGHMVVTCCDEVPGCAGDGGAPGGVGRCLAG